MPTMSELRSRRAEAQARYRDRLRRRGEEVGRPAPETRAVTQSLAAAVRGLAGNVKRSGIATSPLAGALQTVLQSAHRRLVVSGYDRDEAHRRLLLYVRGRDIAQTQSD